MVILISGVTAAARGRRSICCIRGWTPPYLDPGLSAPSDEETSRPTCGATGAPCRPRGKVGIFAGSWYSQPITDRINGHLRRSDLDGRLEDINRFETMLVNEGRWSQILVPPFQGRIPPEGAGKRIRVRRGG